MKTVYFVRHAKSSWENPSLRDMERPLNKRGLRDAPFMARILREKGILPDRLISSPAKRALSTAEIFAAGLGVDDVQIDPRLYEAFPEDVLGVIRDWNDEDEVIFLFGHNPTFHALANLFSPSPLENIPTCGIFRVEASIDHWRDFSKSNAHLTALFFPKQFHT